MAGARLYLAPFVDESRQYAEQVKYLLLRVACTKQNIPNACPAPNFRETLKILLYTKTNIMMKKI